MGIRTLLLIMSLAASMSHAAILQSLVVNETADKTSIVCTFTNSTPAYHGFILTSPVRAVIDLNQTSTSLHLNQLPVEHGLIARLRGGSPTPQTLRLVFDLKHMASLKVVNWKSGMNGAQGLRIVLTTKASLPYHQHQQTTPTTNRTYQTTPTPKPIAVRHVPQSTYRDVIIVIDAGHGGKDPGAIGPRRNVEKNVVLAIALKLKQRIDRQPGMRAVMTRSSDYYVGLRERLNIARKYDADMFVSIHADAFNNPFSNGASVYALSPTGATSEAARWLAEKENYSELGGVDLSGLDDSNGLIRTVLLDLSQTATINAGLQIGGKILRHLGQMTTLHHNRVEQARFVVLKSPDIPSILVETGFISNPHEEFNLTNPMYQTRLSQAIFDGLKQFFWDSPPHGTRLEAMSGGNNILAQGSK